MHTRKSRSPWRIARRIAFALVLISLLPALVWWVANRIDESPSPAALRYAQPDTRVIADADNAWLHLAGLGAAAGDDPAAFGRRRVDALVARQQRSPPSPPDAAEQALFVDPLAVVQPQSELDGTAELCPARVANCVDWAGRHEALLLRLQTANALRLQRYAALTGLRDWQGLYPASADAPLPDAWIASLQRNLLALRLARALSTSERTGQHEALKQLADVTTFWRQIPSQATDLYAVLLSSSHVEASQRLAGDLLDYAALPLDRALDAEIERILQPLPAQIDWSGALSYEYRTFVAQLSPAMPGTLAVVQRCLNGTNADGCVKTFAMDAAFVPQATFNLHAENVAAMQKWLEAKPGAIEAERARYAAAIEAGFIQFEPFPVLLRQLAYNYTGRILVSIAIPAADWGLRLHDAEALRRMLVIKHAALRQGVAVADMADFAVSQPQALRNPYSGEGFAWDAVLRELYFEPKAQYWKRPRLVVGVFAGAVEQEVDACAGAFAFDLTEVVGERTYATVQYATCGLGNRPVWIDDIDAEQTDDPRIEAQERFVDVVARREGTDVAVRLLHHDGKNLHAYETRATLGSAEMEITLSPLGHAQAAQIVLRLRPASPEPLVALRTFNTEVSELARRISTATGVTVRGVERLRAGKATFNDDFELRVALRLIGEVGERNVREISPREFVFEPYPD